MLFMYVRHLRMRSATAAVQWDVNELKFLQLLYFIVAFKFIIEIEKQTKKSKSIGISF